MKKRLLITCLFMISLVVLGCKNSVGDLDEQEFNTEIIQQNTNPDDNTGYDDDIESYYAYESEILKVCNYKKLYEFELYDDVPKIEISIEAYGNTTVSWYLKKQDKDDFGQNVINKTVKLENNMAKLSPLVLSTDYPKNMVYTIEYYAVIEAVKDNIKETYKTDVIKVSKNIVETDIPVMYLDVNNDIKTIDSKKEYKNVNCRVVVDSETVLNANGKVKGRGNSTWSLEKKGYTLKLNDSTSILGMGKSKKWALVANHSDKTLLRNQLACYLGRNVYTNLKWTPDCKRIHLVLNNEYLGEYLIIESIDIANNKVNIQDISKVCNNPGKYKDVNNDGKVDYLDGGFLLEYNLRADENFNFKSIKGFTLSLKTPDTDDFDDENTLQIVENYIEDMYNTAEKQLYDNWKSKDPDIYAKYIDLDSFVDYFILNEFTLNTDSILQNYSCYMYYDPSIQKFCLGPIWDFDISMGNYKNTNVDVTKKMFLSSKWIQMLMNNKDFRTRVKMRWEETQYMLYNTIDSYLMEQAILNTSEAELNFNRWNVLGTKILYNDDDCVNRTTYQEEIDYLRDWLKARFEFENELFLSY